MAIFTKAGVKLADATLQGMFQSVRAPGEGIGDPRVVYDSTSGRFFIAAMGGSFVSPPCAPGTCIAHFFVAVSKHATPSGFSQADWYLYALDVGADGTYGDFARLAVGAKMVVLVGTNNRFSDDTNAGSRIRVIDKSTIVSGQPATWIDFLDMRDPISGRIAYGFQPALNLTAPGTFFLVNHSTGANCGLNVWGIDGSPTSPTLSVRPAVPSDGRNGCPQPTTLAQQPDGVAGLLVSSIAPLSSPVFSRNGSLWIAQQMQTGIVGQGNGVAAVRFAEIDVSRWPTAVSVKQDVVSQVDGTWQFFPSIVVGPANDVALVFNSSSASEYPSIRYAGRSGSDPPSTLRPSAILKSSTVALNSPDPNHGNVNRFGDYTGAAIDPEDGSAWLIGEYVKSSTQWATWVGRVELTPELTAAIATHPTNQSVVAGQTAKFSVVASGAPPPTYQWQVSTSSGTTWTNLTDTAPYSGTAPATLTITGATVGLNANQYRAVATNSVGTATSNAATLTVTAAPSFGTHPSSQSVTAGQNAQFTVTATGTPSPTYQWQVSTNAGSTFTDLANASPYSGVSTATLTVTSTPSSLNGAQYRAVATNSAGTATSTAATLSVTRPMMSVDRTSLMFTAVTTGAAFSSQTGSQAVRLSQTTTGTVTWTAASSSPWLVVSPTAGSGSATLTVSVQVASGLTASQAGSVTLTFSGAGNTAGPIAVTLTTFNGAQAAAPTGSFDTPTDGSTGVTGSIPVTGWAMDDVEVTGVRILRDPVAGEAPGTLVFIGHAVLVDGARPDVQATYPNAPRSSRAGWGYLLLTSFLPNLGNGTVRLYAIADDVDGHSTTLGTKTITCTNSTATAPFGAIDAPGQGETISGRYNNFGWVLSPGTRRSDPPSGGQVRVVIDGALGATPEGWVSRSDLTALFPVAQFSGVGSALAVTPIATTALTNGVHTIAWLVTDNQGSASGVGSRYFTVSNGSLMLDPAQGPVTPRGGSMVISGPTRLSMPRAAALRLDGVASLTAEVNAAPGDVAPLRGRRGYHLDTPLQSYAVRDGVATVHAEEIDRIELHVEAIEGAERRVDGTWTGYLRVPDGLAPLPIGSALNAATGAFTWQPGVAFVGPYDLVFVRWSGDRAVGRQEVRVVLQPKGSSRVGPQTVIDGPTAAAGAAGLGDAFVVAGWAADLDAQADAGVDTVHVWAYRVNAAGTDDDPIWIGAAVYGGARPDVAAVYGERFLPTGYGIRVQGLAPGTYDLAVFAYSTVRHGFVPATTVRVTVPDLAVRSQPKHH